MRRTSRVNARALRFLGELRLVRRAHSRRRETRATLPLDRTGDSVRFSIGIEDVSDLTGDIARALDESADPTLVAGDRLPDGGLRQIEPFPKRVAGPAHSSDQF